uniref:Cytochrome P450 n=1 Tax=Homalodisca liturata TaxID=320908 RepID=A0A1B6HFG5_9HEMI
MTFPPLPALLILISLLLLLVVYVRFRLRYGQVLAIAAKLPCPPTWPVLGNLPSLLLYGVNVSSSKNILRIAEHFKGIFCVWIGPVPIFVIKDPADVQVILNSSATLERNDRYVSFKTFMGNGLLSAPVSIWKKYRKLINPIMRPSNVEHFLHVFNDVGRKLSDKFSVSSPPTDHSDEIFDMALDTIIRTAISQDDFPSETKRDVKYLIHSVPDILMARIFKIWLQIDWLFKLLYRKELKLIFEKLENLLDTVNKGVKAEGEIRTRVPESDESSKRMSGLTLMDVICNNLPVITEDHNWRDEVMTLLATGTDTIVGSLSFLLVTLGNFPEVQDKIIEEVQGVMGDMDRDVTVADVNAMTYLNQVILESIRLHGSVSAISRKATKEIKLSDCTLPAGSRIVLVLLTMGYDKEQFPDPEQFLPERFSPEKQKERHNYSFLPFGGGPRNCIGKTYAIIMMKTVLVHVLRRLRVKSHTKLSDIQYELRVVIHQRFPLLVTFHPR